MASLIIEVLLVGLLTGLLFWAIARFVPLVTPIDLNAPLTALIAGFVVGALFHLSAEYLGMNGWYCRNGAACTRSAF
jgi:hypothetical protein